jgi:hypothetical protein
MRHCKVHIVAAIASLLLATAALADGPVAPRYADAHVTAAQIRGYQSEVEAKADARFKNDSANQRICDSSSEMTIWVFTLPGHPAHPAVSRGVMVFAENDQGTSVGIDRSGHYAGDLNAFKAWMAEFGRLDQRQLAGMSK